METKGANGSVFIRTSEHDRFEEFCDSCARYGYIGLCYGRPGVGKTLSAKHYSRWNVAEDVLNTELLRTQNRHVPDYLIDARAVLYTPPVANTPNIINKGLDERYNWLKSFVTQGVYLHRGWTHKKGPIPYKIDLIIVDEADRLKDLSLEHLRDLYDQRAIGLVLIGMEGLEKRLSRYAQLYSRVGFVHRFRVLEDEEFRAVLGQVWQSTTAGKVELSDAEAIAAIMRITGGNLRLLHRLFSQTIRLLELNDLQAVTKGVVEAARESLVIGTV